MIKDHHEYCRLMSQSFDETKISYLVHLHFQMTIPTITAMRMINPPPSPTHRPTIRGMLGEELQLLAVNKQTHQCKLDSLV